MLVSIKELYYDARPTKSQNFMSRACHEIRQCTVSYVKLIYRTTLTFVDRISGLIWCVLSGLSSPWHGASLGYEGERLGHLVEPFCHKTEVSIFDSPYGPWKISSDVLGVFSASNRNQYLGGKVRPARGAVSCDLPVVPKRQIRDGSQKIFPPI
jgi:hypothetical protein